MTTPTPRRGASPQAPPPRLPAPMLALVAVLLAAPLVGLLWVSSYAKADPHLFGFPFFYWYQFAWVLVAAATTSIAYRIVVRHQRRSRPPRDPGTGDAYVGADR